MQNFENESIQVQAIAKALFFTMVNLMIEALAGSGKTRLIVLLIQELVRQGKSGIVALAYNKAASLELAERLGNLEGVTVSTFHALGMKSIVRSLGRMNLDPTAKWNETKSRLGIKRHLENFVRQLISLAKQTSVNAPDFNSLIDKHDLMSVLFKDCQYISYSDPDFGASPDDLATEGIELAKKGLRLAVDLATGKEKLIDFDDQIWLTLKLDLTLPQTFNYTFADEWQDSNEVRQALLSKATKPEGRIIVVGDRHQAIYGFTGADVEAMDRTVTRFGCESFPLTTCYRCSKAVIAYAQRFVPEIQAHDQAVEGEVRYIFESRETDKLVPWYMTVNFDQADAILCRNTAPLVKLAYSLIANGIACHVEGRKIGEGIISLMRKLAGKRIKTVEALEEKLANYRESQIQNYLAKGKEQQADAIADKCDTLQVFIDLMPDASIEELTDKISSLFQDGAKTLTLCTGHRSKGREWNNVYWLDPAKYQPSKYARQAWQQVQEKNLQYVMATRAKVNLIIVETLEENRRSA